jgi:HSP20 family protein
MFLYDNPWKELERMQRDMDSLFTRMGRSRTRFPSVNLYDGYDAVSAEFIIPGMVKEDLTITFENGSLVVKGERKTAVDDETYSLVREERNYGTFNRSVDIPVQIDAGSIAADLKNGILTVTMPKAEEAKPKQISIN